MKAVCFGDVAGRHLERDRTVRAHLRGVHLPPVRRAPAEACRGDRGRSGGRRDRRGCFMPGSLCKTCGRDAQRAGRVYSAAAWKRHSPSSSRTPSSRRTPGRSSRASKRRASASSPSSGTASRRPRPRGSTPSTRPRASSPALVAYMTSGPVFVAVLERDNGVAHWRAAMGATDPAKADAGTIRKEFGAVDRAERGARLGEPGRRGARGDVLLSGGRAALRPRPCNATSHI